MASNKTVTEQPTIESCIEIQDFFKNNRLLSRACEETGLNLKASERAIKGEAKKMWLVSAIVLGSWMRLWCDQHAERVKLSELCKQHQ